MTFPNFNDAVHAVLPYMQAKGVVGEIKSHFPDICQNYLPVTVPWSMYSMEQRQHVMRCWSYIWQLAQTADEFRIEPADRARHGADMLRRQGHVWEILVFRTSKREASRQKSDRVVQDAMRALRRREDPKMDIRGRSIFFHSNPHAPMAPVLGTIRTD
jgi:hypothetical protein